MQVVAAWAFVPIRLQFPGGEGLPRTLCDQDPSLASTRLPTSLSTDLPARGGVLCWVNAGLWPQTPVPTQVCSVPPPGARSGYFHGASTILSSDGEPVTRA